MYTHQIILRLRKLDFNSRNIIGQHHNLLRHFARGTTCEDPSLHNERHIRDDVIKQGLVAVLQQVNNGRC
jgi:hypothetical protein